MAVRNSTKTSKSAVPSAAVVITPVRNSAIPPRTSGISAPAKRNAPTYEQIALAAYYIWKSGQGGSQEENWFRAERQLRGL